MLDWKPKIDHREGPRYIAIADAIGEAIREGNLKPEQRLPTHRDLAYELGVTVGTITRAYAESVRRDYVVGEVGRGTYVKSANEPTSNFYIPYDIDPDIYDFSLNLPPENASIDDMRRTLMTLAQDQGLGALQRYQSDRGMDHHRESMAKYAFEHGAPLDANRIVLSNGVQNAMTLSMMTVCKSGDTLLCEEYTYTGMKALANRLGVHVEGVAMDEDGLIPDALEKKLQQCGARVLYCMPNYQNPTSIIMSDDRRREIAEIAQKYGVWILEDDIYGFTAANPKDNLSFAQLLPDQTFYLNGVSKCLSPGLRVGFVLAPANKVDNVAISMRASSWMASPMNAEIASRWIEDGTAARLMDWHRQEAMARQEILYKDLQGYDVSSCPGAYHSWVKLPPAWRADMFCMKARERNVSLMPSHIFYTGKREPENAIRLCYGAPLQREKVQEGMSIVAQLLNEEVHAYHSVM